MIHNSPTPRERAMAVQHGLAVVARLERGGPATSNERRHAAVIRERFDRGDIVSPAQAEFMELVEAISETTSAQVRRETKELFTGD